MSINKMLIDATHPEETRVVVLQDGRVEEFDYESAARKLLRGSIYLAKITRVEPSLQAAFVDYGGNRHGFLAFAEIHPDYYQIPHADKLALLEQEAADYHDEDKDDAIIDGDDPAEAGVTEIPIDDDDDEDGDRDASHIGDTDAHDPEADAIDVTDLLPPESEAEGGQTEDGDHRGSPDPAMALRHDGDDRLTGSAANDDHEAGAEDEINQIAIASDEASQEHVTHAPAEDGEDPEEGVGKQIYWR